MKTFTPDDFKIACPHCHKPFAVRVANRDPVMDGFVVSVECSQHYSAFVRLAYDVWRASKENGHEIPFACCEVLTAAELELWAADVEYFLASVPKRVERARNRLDTIRRVQTWRQS